MMESVLQGLPAVAVYLDDIIITGREHYSGSSKEAERSRPTTKERKMNGSCTIGCLLGLQNRCPRTKLNG